MGNPQAAECLHVFRSAGLPVATCWMVPESAAHLLAIALEPDWHDSAATAKEIADQIAHLLFGSRLDIAIPKLLLVENDIEIDDVAQLVYAFATRAHPGQGAFQYPQQLTSPMPVFLDDS